MLHDQAITHQARITTKVATLQLCVGQKRDRHKENVRRNRHVPFNLVCNRGIDNKPPTHCKLQPRARGQRTKQGTRSHVKKSSIFGRYAQERQPLLKRSCCGCLAPGPGSPDSSPSPYHRNTPARSSFIVVSDANCRAVRVWSMCVIRRIRKLSPDCEQRWYDILEVRAHRNVAQIHFVGIRRDILSVFRPQFTDSVRFTEETCVCTPPQH